jgi:hypothetical protein
LDAVTGLGWNEGLERLNAELISCCGEVTVDLGGEIGAGGGDEILGEERPKRSLEREDEGGLGFG